MKRALALLLVALLLAPAARAEPGIQPEFPEDLVARVPAWVAAAEAELAPYADRAWFAEADAFLQKAKREADAGRVRAAMFDVETVHDLVRANLLMEDAALRGSEAERKALAIERTQQWHRDAEAQWMAYRQRLHAAEDDILSLHALEMALYSADIALGAKIGLDAYASLVPEFRKVNFSRETVLSLLRSSSAPGVSLAQADDVLTVALAREGLPPPLKIDRWKEVSASELLPREDATGRLAQYETVAGPVRENGEALLAVAIALAEQRSLRRSTIELQYGDAASRGLETTNTAAINMERRLNRTSYEDVRAHGLLGVFTADAVDQARFVLELHAQGKSSPESVRLVWANLDYQEFTSLVLADVSPIEPETPTNLGEQNNLTRYPSATQGDAKKGAPGPAALAAIVALAAVAALAGRRSRQL